jgi:hypothetical protein
MFRFAGLLVITSTAVSLHTGLAVAETKLPFAGPTLHVRVYNQGAGSDRDINDMKRTVQQILNRSGIQTMWTQCVPSSNKATAEPACKEDPSPRRVISLFLLSDTLKGSRGVVGESVLGSGRATVFYQRAEIIAHSLGELSCGSVLGGVAAHEIGHLLLASRQHSLTGLMKGTWGPRDYTNLVSGVLCFTPEESRSLRRALTPVLMSRDLGNDSVPKKKHVHANRP